MDLLNRWPDPRRPAAWEQTLASVARDETAHLAQVLRHLKKRGGLLERTHKSRYASDLRTLVRRGPGPRELLDRLLISALIEARSCERFERLAEACVDKDLAKFYAGLAKSEAGHYAIFLRLGKSVVPAEEAARRWDDMLDAEARIIQRQPGGPGLHSA